MSSDWRSRVPAGKISTPKSATPKGEHKALECRLCQARYSREDVIEGRYQLATYVCSFCYARLQKLPYEQSCFGKPITILPNGKQLLGYDAETTECLTLCPDREICRRVVITDPV